ncbi:MAG: RNA polymerase subunit sigma-70 [Bacteroidetes bacterium]|nr:MAG: RNA polymerase subunit sigma-70 [Bacteroidota bacterium]
MEQIQSEQILLARLVEDDEKAFNTLFYTYREALLRFVVSIVKIESDAEDIVQHVFATLWSKRKSIDSSKRFSSFLFTIAKNSALNALRSAQSNNAFLKEQIWQQIELERCFTDEAIEHDELLHQIQDSLGKLTPQQRKIFQLSREKGLSHDEIAKKLGLSKNTVKNHISQAILLIKKELGRQ